MGNVTEHNTKTDSNEIINITDKSYEQKRQAMVVARQKAGNRKYENSVSKSFILVNTATEKVFYLMADRDGEETGKWYIFD